MNKEGGQENPELNIIRSRDQTSSVIVFVHGFTGTADTTWGRFIRILQDDRQFGEWDIYSIGYRSRLAVDLPIWAADPKLDICALGLRTKLTHPPLEHYKAVAVVAHSMGGLVVQRAVLDHAALRGRVSHVVLYGSPSGGLRKARFGRLLKRQVADMAEGGEFIRSLRRDWEQTFEGRPPFEFRAVAGSEDSFVPPESSLMPFQDRYREVVPGDHIDIVHPKTIESPSYIVLVKALTESGALRSKVESARLAAETKQYDSVVDTLLPIARNLDNDAIVTLALALESLGRQEEATQVVENHFKQGVAALDAVGALAGRLKRRWLFLRATTDYERSLALYEGALKRAVELDEPEQAYYHGINAAFLKLMRGPEHMDVSQEARKAAEVARALAKKAAETSWSVATIGEASLMLGELEVGLAAYRQARELAETVRAQQSMFSQALQVASRVYGEEGEIAIRYEFEGL